MQEEVLVDELESLSPILGSHIADLGKVSKQLLLCPTGMMNFLIAYSVAFETRPMPYQNADNFFYSGSGIKANSNLFS